MSPLAWFALSVLVWLAVATPYLALLAAHGRREKRLDALGVGR